MAVRTCEKLIQMNIAEDCSAPIVKGWEKIGYIMNKSDIASFTRSGNKVSSITLASGAKAYEIYNTGNNPFTGTTTALNVADIRNTFDKTAGFMVLDDGDVVTEKIVDQLANGSFVVVLEQTFTNGGSGENKFEIIGLECGAKATEINKDRTSDDTRGGYQVVLTESQAPTSGLFFFNTDIATSRAALNALL